MQKNGDQEDGDFALFGGKEREDVWGRERVWIVYVGKFYRGGNFLVPFIYVEVKLDYRIISFVVNIFN